MRREFEVGILMSGANDTKIYYEHMVNTKKTQMFEVGLDQFTRLLNEASQKNHDASFLVLERVLTRMYVQRTGQEFIDFTGFVYYKKHKTCAKEAFVIDYKNAAMILHARINDGQTPTSKLHNKKRLQNTYSSIDAKSLMRFSLGFTKRVYNLL